MDDAFAAGDGFLLNEARLIERRLFATCFLGASPSGVVNALRGYQNEDGGFGQALEPDTRCPASLPIYVETAFKALATAGTVDGSMVRAACEFLARSAAEAGASGAVAPASPDHRVLPSGGALDGVDLRAGPQSDRRAGGPALSARLRAPLEGPGGPLLLGAARGGHGARRCAHGAGELRLLRTCARAGTRQMTVPWRLPAILRIFAGLHLDPKTPGYGLSPLHFAPRPTSRWRKLFTGAQIASALEHLEQSQEPDGGWPITWEPPSQAAKLEWRGVVTLEALRTLVAYGRIVPRF